MIEIQDVSFAYRTTFSGEEREDDLGRAKDGRGGGSGKDDGSGRGGVRGLSLRIARGECVLLCGASGCGKTTIARLVNGLIPHFFEGKLAGTVCVNGMDSQETEIAAFSDAVGTVFQNPRTQFFNADVDSEIVFGLENRGIARAQLRARLDDVTEELHLQALRGRSVFELSGGEKQKIAFSSAYASDPNVLVFDEPSSNLDMRSIEELAKLMRTAKEKGKTILVAEHRIWYLMDIVDRVIYLQDGAIVSDMPIEDFRKLSAKNVRSRGLRSRDLAALQPKATACPSASGNVLSLENLSVRLGGAEVLKGISFQANAGEIIAIAGANGTGKTTLARAICGLANDASGTVRWNGRPLNRRVRRKKAYMVMQDVGHQLFSDSVMEECRLGIKDPDRDVIESALRRVDLLACKDRHPLSLSGGQMQRLAVAVSEVCGKDLLVFDEPTSGLDLRSMEEVGGLVRVLADQGKILLVITHDVEFMMRICTRILVLEDGCVAADLSGGKRGLIVDLMRGGKR